MLFDDYSLLVNFILIGAIFIVLTLYILMLESVIFKRMENQDFTIKLLMTTQLDVPSSSSIYYPGNFSPLAGVGQKLDVPYKLKNEDIKII